MFTSFDKKMSVLIGLAAATVGSICLLGGCSNQQFAAAVTQGQLFCATETRVVSVINTSVIGKTADQVAAICTGLNGIPMPAPAASTTVVAVAAP